MTFAIVERRQSMGDGEWYHVVVCPDCDRTDTWPYHGDSTGRDRAQWVADKHNREVHTPNKEKQ